MPDPHDLTQVSPVPRNNSDYGSGGDSKTHSRESSISSIRIQSPPSIEIPQLFEDDNPHDRTNSDYLFPGGMMGSPISSQSCSSFGPHTITRVPTPNSAGLDNGFLALETGLRRSRSESALRPSRTHQFRGEDIRSRSTLFPPEGGANDFMLSGLPRSWPLELSPSIRRHRHSKSDGAVGPQHVRQWDQSRNEDIRADSPLLLTEDAAIRRRSPFRSHTTTQGQLNPSFPLRAPPDSARLDNVFLSPHPPANLMRSSSDAASRPSHIRQLRSEDMRFGPTLFPPKGGAGDSMQNSQFLSPVQRHHRSLSTGGSAGLDDGFFSSESGPSHPKSDVASRSPSYNSRGRH
ncbi:hypothetical protein B0H12DRAFT_1122524 [Mycena haematopus]|nr:hypothetical protein B0H12DRAFT_1122524 [Mycena haematopus]